MAVVYWSTLGFHANKPRPLHLTAVAKASSVPGKTQTAVLVSSGAANPIVPVLKCWVLSFSPALAVRDFTFCKL
jgi:hypothetical protein